MTAPIPNAAAPSPEPALAPRKRFVKLACAECGESVGCCLPEDADRLVLCPDCAPSEAATHRSLTADELAAVRADEETQLRAGQHLQHRTEIGALSTRFDEVHAQVDAVSRQVADLSARLIE